MITERPRRTSHPPSRQMPSDEPPPVVFYLGQRIYFRPLELGDEPLLRRWINDPRVWINLNHRGPLNAGREREWLESLYKPPGQYVFGVVVKEDDRLIGVCGLNGVKPIPRSASLGISIGDVEYQGRGYGTEAVRLALRYGFRELNLNRIELSVFSHNWRAIRVYQKAGFVSEGCLRQAAFRSGRYVDEYRFAILREEWDSLPSVTPNRGRFETATDCQGGEVSGS